MENKEFKIELLVIFAVFVSLGFPGNYEEIYGEKFGMLMEYGAFLIEIAAMLLSSGKNWLDIQILNFDKKYGMIYLFTAVIFGVSMLVTRYSSLQIITCARLTVTILFAIWLQEQFSFGHVIRLLCIAQTLFLLANAVFILQFPSAAFESGDTYFQALRGLYSTKNTLASELSFGIFVMIFAVREKRKQKESTFFWMLLIILQMILVTMCQAMGALAGLILVLFLFFLCEDHRLPLGWIYTVTSVGFLFAMLTLMPAFEWFFDAIGKDATLTGRIPLWNQIITVMMNHNTLMGFGYGMFWRDSRAVALVHAGFSENSFMGQMTTGAHNMLLEYWLNSGLIGIAMLFILILYAMREIEALSEQKYRFSFLILFYLMINGFTERCLGGNYDYKTLVLFLVLSACCNRADSGNGDMDCRQEPNGIG